jgi:hypothetical protein
MCRQLALCWGVSPLRVSDAELQEPAELAKRAVQQVGLATPGQHLLLVWDQNPLHAGIAPSVSILTV